MEENKKTGERKAQLMDILLKDEPLSAEDEALCVCCSMDSLEGAELCAVFTDDELLELLRVTARRLDHSPAQGEVHWLLRQYLRSRFRNWPGTLRAAGLSRAAGRGGLSCEETARNEQEVMQMLSRVREAAERLGRIPHPSELPEVCQTLHKRYQTWGQVLAAAGVEQAVAGGLRKADDLEEEDRQRLGQLRATAQKLNRAPLRSEIEEELRTPLIRRFGSWRNVLYQVDLEPVQRISPFVNAPLRREESRSRATHRDDLYDCHYRLLRLEPETAADLELVRRLAEELGHTPHRREVSAEVRRRLQDSCGTWSNALFQLGLQE